MTRETEGGNEEPYKGKFNVRERKDKNRQRKQYFHLWFGTIELSNENIQVRCSLLGKSLLLLDDAMASRAIIAVVSG